MIVFDFLVGIIFPVLKVDFSAISLWIRSKLFSRSREGEHFSFRVIRLMSCLISASEHIPSNFLMSYRFCFEVRNLFMEIESTMKRISLNEKPLLIRAK